MPVQTITKTASAVSTRTKVIVTTAIIGAAGLAAALLPSTSTPTFDYQLAMDKTAVTVVAGNTLTSTITVTAISGTPSVVTFGAGTNSTTLNPSFSPASCTPSNTICTSIMTVLIPSVHPTGDYYIYVDGRVAGTETVYDSSGNAPQRARITITISPAVAAAPATSGYCYCNGSLTDAAACNLECGENDGWTDTTPAAPTTSDTTPPYALSFEPGSNATNVPVGTSLTVTFSEPILVSSVNHTNIILTSANSDVRIEGAIIYGTPGTTTITSATFDPSNSLAPNTQYIFGTGAGITDPAGNKSGTNSIIFTTGASIVAPAPVAVTAGTLNISLDTITPSSRTLTAGISDNEMTIVRFSASGEAFNIDKLTVTNDPASDDDNLYTSVTIKYPDNAGIGQNATSLFVNGLATFSGLQFFVPEIGGAIITLRGNLNTIAGGALSGQTTRLGIDGDSAFNAFGWSSNYAIDQSAPGIVDVNGNAFTVNAPAPVTMRRTYYCNAPTDKPANSTWWGEESSYMQTFITGQVPVTYTPPNTTTHWASAGVVNSCDYQCTTNANALTKINNCTNAIPAAQGINTTAATYASGDPAGSTKWTQALNTTTCVLNPATKICNYSCPTGTTDLSVTTSSGTAHTCVNNVSASISNPKESIAAPTGTGNYIFRATAATAAAYCDKFPLPKIAGNSVYRTTSAYTSADARTVSQSVGNACLGQSYFWNFVNGAWVRELFTCSNLNNKAIKTINCRL